MATIYQRLTALNLKLTAEEKNFLGQSVHKDYSKNHLLTGALSMATSIEENGTFKVFAYPKGYTTFMDIIIQDFIKEKNKSVVVKPKKNRKRILVKK
jgi:hypothetical protein